MGATHWCNLRVGIRLFSINDEILLGFCSIGRPRRAQARPLSDSNSTVSSLDSFSIFKKYTMSRSVPQGRGKAVLVLVTFQPPTKIMKIYLCLSTHDTLIYLGTHIYKNGALKKKVS